MLTRAYSLLTVKAVDEERRTFSGYATTPEVDRVGDVVEPKGAKFSNPLALLLFHQSSLPVGTAEFGTPTKDGIPFTASIPDVPEAGKLKDRVDEAWQSVKHRVIRGVSIGFRVLDDGIELMKTGGYRFTKYEVLELSLVAVPANAGATINSIKAIDAPYLAESGNEVASGDVVSSAVVDPSVKPARKGAIKIMTKKTTADQIAGLEATRVAKAAAMTELQEKVTAEGRTKSAEERQQFDDLKDEITGIDAELKDLRDMEAMNVAALVAAPEVRGVAAAGAARGGAASVSVNDPKLPPGIGFARYAMAAVRSYKEHRPIAEIAKQMWPSHTALHSFIEKASVPAGTTTDPVWASPLVDQTNLPGEFIEYLRPMTIVGQLDLRRVPFNVRVIGQTSGGTGYWVGQGKPKPLTSFAFNATTMLWTKVAAIAVITEELARFSSPSAEGLVRDALSGALIQRMDEDFIDPSQAGTANVQPASVTYGLTALTSAGTSADNVRTDLMRLLSTYVSTNQRSTRLAIVMPDTLALGLSLMTNALGQPEFPGIGPGGGTLRGIKVVTSQYAANQSGYGNLVVAINQDEVFLADDGAVQIDVSREASLQMLDNPTNASDTAVPTTSVSMFQTNSIAIRAERFVNWQKRRTEAVALLDDVNWGSVGSPS
jgi:HK97 family phage major capsid protein/HK97 family phage prohead protease